MFVLSTFIPKIMLFKTLTSTASAYSKPSYGQICGQKPLPTKNGKRFAHLEDLFKTMLPRGTHHLLYTSGEHFLMLWADGAEVVPQRSLGEFQAQIGGTGKCT